MELEQREQWKDREDREDRELDGQQPARAILMLEDGRHFYGKPFGAVETLWKGRRGEVVFATSMTGYQEICTDPSYRGQIVALTYPLIGNYGVSAPYAESRRPWLSALIVREYCDEYSNWRATQSLDAYLRQSGIPGLAEVDTRALTRHLRTHGTRRGVIQACSPGLAPDLEQLLAAANAVKSVSDLDVVGEVAETHTSQWSSPSLPPDAPRVLLVDTGFKESIARCLTQCGLQVIISPPNIDLPTIRRLNPDGIVLSNGPGDPECVANLIELTRALVWDEHLPLLGICLGHQILGLAAGAQTSRLPFGHHGANHPVREERTGIVTITSQNHNFQVDAFSIPSSSGLYVSHVNLSDGSVEGLAHVELPVFSVQYHPEAAPGPQDNRRLFERFAALVSNRRAGAHAKR